MYNLYIFQVLKLNFANIICCMNYLYQSKNVVQLLFKHNNNLNEQYPKTIVNFNSDYFNVH